MTDHLGRDGLPILRFRVMYRGSRPNGGNGSAVGPIKTALSAKAPYHESALPKRKRLPCGRLFCVGKGAGKQA